MSEVTRILLSDPDHGGVQRKGGRARMAAELRRSDEVRVMLRPWEYRTLQRVAEAWGVPLATAAWAIVADALARTRGWESSYGCELAARLTAAALVGVPVPAEQVVRKPSAGRPERERARAVGLPADRAAEVTAACRAAGMELPGRPRVRARAEEAIAAGLEAQGPGGGGDAHGGE